MPDFPPPPVDAQAERAETRRAVRLVGWVGLVAVGLYLLLGSVVVTEDSLLTRYGRATEEIEFVSLRAEALDREERYGSRPVVWIMGSSITRESFDREELAEELAEAGLDWGAEKYAFDRGAPLFTWAFLDRIDIRPGDHVITTVGIDNFRRDWIAYYGNVDSHIHYLLSPAEVFRVRSLSWAARLDYALAWLPPRSFWKYRDTFRQGLQAWLVYWFDPVIDHKPPVLREEHRRQPFQDRMRIRNFDRFRHLQIRNQLPAEDFGPEPGQVNYDALWWWVEEVEARGGRAWVLYVPHNPLYFEHDFAGPEVVEAFHAAMGQLGDRYAPLSPRPAGEYQDYRHPNRLGRARYTRELAELLSTAERSR